MWEKKRFFWVPLLNVQIGLLQLMTTIIIINMNSKAEKKSIFVWFNEHPNWMYALKFDLTLFQRLLTRTKERLQANVNDSRSF